MRAVDLISPDSNVVPEGEGWRRRTILASIHQSSAATFLIMMTLTYARSRAYSGVSACAKDLAPWDILPVSTQDPTPPPSR
jgi:hypothetical protein